MPSGIDVRSVAIPPIGLPGTLSIPAGAEAVVVFVHGSGSSRLSPRNIQVSDALVRLGFATLLFDLLTEDEERDRTNVFDIPLLAQRVDDSVRWLDHERATRGLKVGLFGASTGAAAALVAAGALGSRIGAVVSRGGRPDLAVDALARVRSPTLLIVGGADTDVLDLNRQALKRLRCEKSLAVVPHATHLFPERGALEAVISHAARWFARHIGTDGLFRNRRDAGVRLALALETYKARRPVVMALPRGGVPVAAEVATALDAPLDLVLVRKIGVPIQPELAMGAVADGGTPTVVRNEEVIRLAGVDEEAFKRAQDRELREIERRRHTYLGDRPPIDVAGRLVIVVDDGIATGATTRAALRSVAARKPSALVLAVPVAPPSAAAELRLEVDELVCLETPEDFFAIGTYYDDFSQVSDDEVRRLLAEHRQRDSAQ